VPPIHDYLSGVGLADPMARLLADAASVGLLALVAFAVNLLFTRVLHRLVEAFARRTRTRIDEALVDKGAFLRLSHIAPAFAIYALAPLVLADSEQLQYAARIVVNVYVVVIGYLVLDAVINAALHLYENTELGGRVALRTLGQAAKLIGALLTFVLILSALFDRNPLYFVSGLGALTAVLLLVFKDAILGFVAGIQLSVNDMVRVGDWIEMPSRGADGDVVDVALTAVKVQNWDKTITTVPTWALVSESFRNWRSMPESGGRRIKRALSFDMDTVHFLSEREIEALREFPALRTYLDERTKEIAAWNAERGLEAAPAGAGRALTNLGTFRAYVVHWLRAHPLVNQEMTLLVRQLAPGPTGVAIEVYAFSADTRWVEYEDLQSDIFDHLIAVAPRFGLRVFQYDAAPPPAPPP
jgi:miniconductance mechanosensitive channel